MHFLDLKMLFPLWNITRGLISTSLTESIMFQMIVTPPNIISEVMISEQGFLGLLFLVTDNTTLAAVSS